MDGLHVSGRFFYRLSKVLLVGGLLLTGLRHARADAATRPAADAPSAVAVDVPRATVPEAATLPAAKEPTVQITPVQSLPANGVIEPSIISVDPNAPPKVKSHFDAMPIRAADGSAGTRADAAASGNGSAMMGRMYTLLQVGGALAAVIGLALIGRVAVKKFAPNLTVNNGKGVIETLVRYPLAKNQQLVLVRVGSQLVLLNQGRENSQPVLVINEPMEVAKVIGQIEGAKPNSIQNDFNKLLANAAMELEAPDARQAFEAAESIETGEDLDGQLDEMAAAKRQLMELREQVRSVRENLPA